jgi:hypothetical protein
MNILRGIVVVGYDLLELEVDPLLGIEWASFLHAVFIEVYVASKTCAAAYQQKERPIG